MTERPYEFRKRLSIVHKPDRLNPTIRRETHEIAIEEGWAIVVSAQADDLILNVAKDLQDYLFVSMHVSVLLRRTTNIRAEMQSGHRVIVLTTKEELPEAGENLSEERSYRAVVTPERVIVCGNDERGVGQGSYYLEDLMNLKEAPLLPKDDVIRRPLFSPRMVHSGWGLDQFPDSHLNAIAHAGMDSILVFVKDVNRTPGGYLDFNNLVDRAAAYGLDVYVYSYLKSEKHPEQPEAEEYYDSTYGEIFKHCPRFKGVILVGESCEFPSKDPNTTQTLRKDNVGTLPPTKPSPGWWPCYDYPQWLNMIKKVIRKHNADADIVFWTYNWGWAPEEERLALIRNLPDDITLLVTFEMFEQMEREGITNVCVDYTVSFAGPGRYFKSEAKVARERGLKLYTMSNTGGLTWDFGVIPYEPVPYQWAKRHTALLKAREEWGLSGLMESHHFGWWPSFVSEMAKWAYWSPSPSAEEISQQIVQRDFGKAAAPLVLEAWREWSEAIQHYVPTNEDQYGPFRIGPSYPMVFRRDVTVPAAWHAMFGNRIIITQYQPAESARQSLGAVRVDVEIKSLRRMIDHWQKGLDQLEKAREEIGEKKTPALQDLIRLGRFILHSTWTTVHLKQWWKLKQRLFVEPDLRRSHRLLDELVQIAEQEITNAQATIPLVEEDSRLGWEPSMDYMTDSEHLQWKIEQVTRVLESEIPQYRQSLELTSR